MNARPLSATLIAICLAPAALGQLTPDRTYYGVRRPAPMTVAIPEDLKFKADEAGQIKVSLLAAVTGKEVESAAVVPGPIDLAAAFPTLWDSAEPTLLYAQLSVGEQKVGPAVVLQPMVAPRYAAQIDRSMNPMFPPPPSPSMRAYSGIRAYVDKNVVLHTDKGDITVALRPDVAPNTAWNFRGLVEGGYYTDIIFHRIVNSPRPFVIQVGDPLGQGNGGPGYYVDLEPSTLPHDFGVLSMARTNDPNTNGSQVFLCLSREGTAPLDNKYTSFGQTIAGGDVIRAIASVPVDPGDRPVGEAPKIKSAELVDAAPYQGAAAPDAAPTAPATNDR